MLNADEYASRPIARFLPFTRRFLPRVDPAFVWASGMSSLFWGDQSTGGLLQHGCDIRGTIHPGFSGGPELKAKFQRETKVAIRVELLKEREHETPGHNIHPPVRGSLPALCSPWN